MYKGFRKEYAQIAIKGKHSKCRKAICRIGKRGSGGQLGNVRTTLKTEYTRKIKTNSK